MARLRIRGLRALTTSRRRRLGAGLALVVAVAVVLAIVLSAGSASPTSAASNTGTASGAATVQRRDLVETDTEAGTLSYADPQTVYNRMSGTITWLPRVGEVIKPGQTLYKVDGRPVTLMNGSTPAYRDLTPSDSPGPDITELNRDLVALDFNPDGITVDDTWQAGTTAGVELFQESLGETPTGSLSLGQVVFLPGDQLIGTVDATLGGTGGNGSGNSGSATSTPVSGNRPEFVSLTTTTMGTSPATTTPTTTPTTTTTTPTALTTPKKHHKRSSHRPTGRQTLAALVALLQAEIAQLKAEHAASPGGHSPGSGSNGNGSGGNGGNGSSNKPSSSSGSSGGTPASSDSGGGGSGGTAQAIMQTTSTQLVVTVQLPATVQSEAVVGERVTVEMPAGNTVAGKITAVSPVAQNSNNNGNGNGNGGGGGGGGGGANGGSGSSSTIPVTVTLKGHQAGAGLDQAAVSVNFAQAKANNVLSVPVTALLATSGGNYAVQQAAPPHHLIPVTTGLFAAGYVQISGPGIYQGLQVTDSQG